MKINKTQAKWLAHFFWWVAIGLAFWSDWRIGIALIALDTSRYFGKVVDLIEAYQARGNDENKKD